jgi:hypothetical protein
MTATTLGRTGPRPVAWSGLAWVTWRQHRAALAGACALLGVLAAYLGYMGLEMHGAYAKVAACRPGSSAACQQLLNTFNQDYYGSQRGSVLSSGINAQTVPFFLLAVPILLGVFMGGPVLARELESGTFRFAWTQGCGRLRWTVAKLVLLASALSLAAYGLSVLFAWYFSPFFAEGKTGKFPMQLFGNLGIDFAAWTLLAFAVAAFLGVVIRRAVPAMATALAACTVLDVATMMSLRQHYVSASLASGVNPPSGTYAWVLSQWLTGPGGRQVSVFSIPMSVEMSSNPNAFGAWLHAQHITQWWSYLPGSKFWELQLIEGGWILAASAILLAATVVIVRRRAA